jgi:flagellar biosynthesis/type III secretory pathway protein FliH
MDLIRESINNPNNPNINLQKVGIQRANFLIDIDNLTPQEREKQKLAETAKVAKKVYEEAATAEGLAKGLAKGLAEGLSKGLAKGLVEGAKKTKDDNILKALKRGKLSVEEIAEDNDVKVDYVLNIQKEIK